ncbi:MAG TPA: hypothetical protein VGL59_06360 [Polyangia bacterium]|jgi:hypothetical protein
MKRSVVTAFVVALLGVAAAPAARATEVGYSRRFGLGLAVGDPTGLVAKLWVSPTNAVDFGLGFQHYGLQRCDVDGIHCDYAYREFSFNADYLWQSNLVKGPFQLDWHIGAGGRIYSFSDNNRYEHDFDLGARMPIGLDGMFRNPGFLEIYFEVAPVLLLLPLDFDLEGALGVRFYF